jgi:hypothetical protein
MNTRVFAVAGMGSDNDRSWTLASVVGRRVAVDFNWRDPIEVRCLIDGTGAPYRRRLDVAYTFACPFYISARDHHQQQQRVYFYDVVETSTGCFIRRAWSALQDGVMNMVKRDFEHMYERMTARGLALLDAAAVNYPGS